MMDFLTDFSICSDSQLTRQRTLELLFSFLLLLLLMGLMIHSYQAAIHKAITLKGLAEILQAREAAALHYQVLGYWPEADDTSVADRFDMESRGSSNVNYSFNYEGGGTFHITYNFVSQPNQASTLSYRWAKPTTEGSYNLLWLCGKRDEIGPPYPMLLGKNRTNMKENNLLRICK